MLARDYSASSSNSSICDFNVDFEVCEGELLEYDAALDLDTPSIDFTDGFTYSTSWEVRETVAGRAAPSSPFASIETPEKLDTGKGKGKAFSGLSSAKANAAAAAASTANMMLSSSSYDERDQYHPDSARQEIVDQILSRRHGMTGQISAKSLQHSCESWNNYSDVCMAVAETLWQRGFPGASVHSIRVGRERQIVYAL